MYILNDLCKTWFHGRHLIDSRVALLSKPLPRSNMYAFNLTKVLITLMGFPRLVPAI